jgi:hypothetical protein
MKLPDELAILEAELSCRPRPAPPAELRQRVLAAARAEVVRGWGAFAAALAAAALLVLHLGVIGAMQTNYLRPSAAPNGEGLVAEMRRVVPDMSEAECRRYARLSATRR